MGNIVWLSSYPKSGNTWLRVLLSNLLNQRNSPADINQLSIHHHSASRGDFDRLLNVESSDMTRDEIERIRPVFYRCLAASCASSLYVKVHDAYVYTSRGEPLIPADVSDRAVYLVRNPLDVASSFAHHSRRTIDTIIRWMGDPEFAFCADEDRLKEQLEQRLLSWSGHVVSWLDQKMIPVHLMRYEDMHREPVAIFNGCLKFLGVEADSAAVERALTFSSFEVLSGQERAYGFREKTPMADSFFRKGKADDWRGCLTERHVEHILRDHSEVMRRLGYIANDGSVF